jgi:hypothetical protein
MYGKDDDRALRLNRGIFLNREVGHSAALNHGEGNRSARHLKTADDLFDSQPSPKTESLVAAAVQWADRIMGSGAV